VTSPQDAAAAPLLATVEIPTDPFSVRILDAAYEEFLSFGLRRATLDQIARRAKVGRMTVHRRFDSKQHLIATVLTRENARVVGELVRVAAAQPTVVDALVESLACGIEAIHNHPLFGRLLETDRDDLAPFLTFEAGPLMAEATGFIAGQLERRQASALAGPCAAEAIFRVCHSILLAPAGRCDLTDPEALRKFLRAVISVLVPVRD
jgi:AcrR family transcriptional regulator